MEMYRLKLKIFESPLLNVIGSSFWIRVCVCVHLVGFIHQHALN